jgi:NADH-quinone oxidoreductase subunit G
MRKESGVAEVGWDEAIARVASEMKAFRKGEIAVIGSPYDTNEDNYMLQKFAREVLGSRFIDFRRRPNEGEDDDLLIRADRTPNARGAFEVGVRPAEGGPHFEGIVREIREGNIKALYVLDDNIALDAETARTLGRLDFLVVHSPRENETTRCADVVFPSSTYAEKNGSFVNFQGRVQRIRPAVAVLEVDRAMDGFEMSRLDRFGSPYDRWARGAKRDARPAWRIIAGVASLMGAKFRYQKAEDVFSEIAAHVEAFRGMSYRNLGNKGAALKAGSSARVGAPA